MKKIMALMLSLILTFGLMVPAFASSADYTFTALVDKNQVEVGDTVTVSLAVSCNTSTEFDLYSMQNYLVFDRDKFELVDGSIEVLQDDSGLTSVDVVKASPIKFSGSKYDRVFANRVSSSAYHASNGVVLYSFKLKAIANGTSEIINDTPEMLGNYASADYKTYSVDVVNASVKVGKDTSTGGGSSSGGSSGGGGGGVVIPSTPSVSTPTTSTDKVTVSATVKATVSGDVAKATVSDSVVKDAIAKAVETKQENQQAVVEVNVETANNVKEVKASLSASAIENLAKNDATLKISSSVASVELPKDVLENIAKQANGADVTLDIREMNVNELTAQQQAALGENKNVTIINLSIETANGKISNLGGNVTVAVPYTPEANAKVANLVVWFVADDGKISPCEGSYDSASNSFIFITNHFSSYVVADFPFSDIKNNAWYYNEVAQSYNNKLMSGVAQGQFAPDVTTNRAMLVSVLHRLEGEIPTSSPINFKDVKDSDYYAEAVKWAVANDVAKGYSEDTFAPTDKLTREQMVAMLWNYAGAPVVDNEAILDKYTDKAQISDWAKPAMIWANQTGVLGGKTANTIAPKDSATRAEFAVILQRFLKLNK